MIGTWFESADRQCTCDVSHIAGELHTTVPFAGRQVEVAVDAELPVRSLGWQIGSLVRSLDADAVLQPGDVDGLGAVAIHQTHQLSRPPQQGDDWLGVYH